MSDESLVVKIGADVSEAKEGIKQTATAVQNAADAAKKASDSTEGLFAFESLQKLGEIAHEGFEILREEMAKSIEAYAEAEKASIQLTAAMQNQGIYSAELKEKYDEYAESVSRLTGFQGDQLTSAQAVFQSIAGQIPITERITKSIADLAVMQGISLPQAAQSMAQAMTGGVSTLTRLGLRFDATATQSERLNKTLEFVQIRAGGMAEATNQGLGSMRGLEAALNESYEALGKRFAPAVTEAIKLLTDFIRPSKDANDVIMDFKAVLLVTGTVLTGTAVALPALASGFIAVKNAAKLMNLELTGAKVALAGLGIGLVVIALTELALHWDSVSARVIQIVKGLVSTVSGAFKGVSEVISGAFHLDPARIKAGLAEIGNAFKEGTHTAFAEIPKETEKALQEQDVVKKKFADKAAAEARAHSSILAQIAKAQQQAVKLELENGYKDEIELKKKEIETLTQLEKTHDAQQIKLLQQRLDQIRKLEDKAEAENKKRRAAQEKLELSSESSLNLRRIKMSKELTDAQRAELQNRVKTQEQIEQEAYQKELQNEIDAHNKFLEEQNKYGTAYALINEAIHSDEYQGFSTASQNLAQLVNSKNKELKAIGKAAAVANIAIQTAQSAMNIFTGFSAIPIVGPALGLAGAAAAIAYGVEKEHDVLAAQTGGLVEGGVPGRDSVPALLEPGELVVPRQNFDQVVAAAKPSGEGAAKFDDSRIVEGLKAIDDHLGKVGTGETYVTNINGDVMSDRNFIDALVRKINMAIQYRNLKLVTSTAGT